MSLSNASDTFRSAANVTCNETALHLQRQPDADVAGIGVILSFLIPSFISVFGVIAAYAAGLINDELLTTADREFFHVEDRVLLSTSGRWARWAEGMEKGILWFSDVQLIFGVGLLISGTIQLQSISIYHIQMVTYQAWMASNMHLVTLTVLREYFRVNKILRNVRVVGMLILAGLLAVVLIPTSSTAAKNILLGRLVDSSQSYGFNAPARCFFTANQGLAGPIDPDAPWSFILLTISYLWKISCLFDSCRCAFLRHVRAAPLAKIEQRLSQLARQSPDSDASFFRRHHYNILLGLYVTLVMIFDFMASFALSLYFLVLNLAWGTVQILVPRFAFNASADVSQSENSWGFGQILPLLLLLLPPLALLEHFYGHTEEDRTLSWKLRTPHYQPDYYIEVDEDATKLESAIHSRCKLSTAKIVPMRPRYPSTVSATSQTHLLSPVVSATAPSPSSDAGSEAKTQLLSPPLPLPSPPLAPQQMSPAAALFHRDSDIDAAPLDANCAIHEFFLKEHLTKHERTTLHLLFYQSRTFRTGMLVWNLGTIAIICELVILVLMGHSTGELWILTLGIPGVALGIVFLVLACGSMMDSRLFRLHVNVNAE